VNVHGQIVPLIDLGILIGTPPCAEPTFAIILGGARAEIGIVAQALIEMREIPRDTLAASTPAPRPIVRHITADGIAVIDGAALIADPRLTHEENVR
jgi:chemotaxis signal transduction protein